MAESFIVICRDDDKSDGSKGEYVLATRREFTRAGAETFAKGIAEGREPMVVECPNGLHYANDWHDHERLSDTLEIETKRGQKITASKQTAPELFEAWAAWTSLQHQYAAEAEDWGVVLLAANVHLSRRSDITQGDYPADVRAIV